jgi:hypothetical protein
VSLHLHRQLHKAVYVRGMLVCTYGRPTVIGRAAAHPPIMGIPRKADALSDSCVHTCLLAGWLAPEILLGPPSPPATLRTMC